MRDLRVILELEKVIPITIKEGVDPELEASKMIDEMIGMDKKNDSYLSTFEVDEYNIEYIEEDLTFTLVKKAIDSFDPYFVLPDVPNEYDPESRRIAEKIKARMSVNEIAEIMKEEFNFSFSAEFTREDFSHTAETTFNLLEDCLNKSDNNESKMGKMIYIYAKLILTKVIPVKILEKEDERLENAEAKSIKMVFEKIDAEKELESFLSSFNISVGWGTGVI
ncbi:MAG: hypothetical protein ACTHVE_04740 [Senegalia sp. (in: firmicutes)]|uniref:hypothetical protein n=1 Tax=Senegalia sp. (in: firmicutes) TaxID=1924098 RepID=UPI003F97B321